MAEIKSINELLSMNLNIPDYQRPYKWDIQNNTIGIFSKISLARMHHEISGLQINVRRDPDSPSHEKWKELYDTIKEINGYGGAQ